MSALRLSLPGREPEYTDLGPANGITRTRYGVPGGAIVRPAPAITPAMRHEEAARGRRRRAMGASGLIRDSETPEAALRRLEKRPNYAALIATDEGQTLLADVARRARQART